MLWNDGQGSGKDRAGGLGVSRMGKKGIWNRVSLGQSKEGKQGGGRKEHCFSMDPKEV